MKKKVFIILLLGLIFFLIGQQIYWFTKLGGNTIVYISNQSIKIDTVHIEAYIDGKRVIAGDFNNKTFHNYLQYPLQTSFGRHTILIKAKDLGISQETSFRTLIMKWIIVDFFEEDVSAGNKNEHKFLITTKSIPLVIE